MWLKSAYGKNNGKVRDNSSLATKAWLDLKKPLQLNCPSGHFYSLSRIAAGKNVITRWPATDCVVSFIFSPKGISVHCKPARTP